MAEDTSTTSDEATVDAAPSFQPDRKAYVVVSENGLFKNGKNYKRGSTVDLDENTAANFLAAGDIEEQA